MQILSTNDQTILTLLANQNAKIIDDEKDRNMYLAIPRGDKRCRPIAWINEVTLNRFLENGSLLQDGNHYILAAQSLN